MGSTMEKNIENTLNITLEIAMERTMEITCTKNETLKDVCIDDFFPSPRFDRRTSDRRASGRRASDGINNVIIPLKKITVLIPCYNEEKGIGKVIDGVPKEKLYQLGYKVEIIVINNNSSDRTIKVALEKGVRVVSEEKQGKGNALKTGFSSVSDDTDYVVMLDGDNTYKSQEISRLIEPLENDFCDVVIGSRLEGKLNGDSLSLSHRLANWFFTFLVRRFYLVNTTDTCTGYFAWKKKVVDELNHHIKSDGFAIEAEMITKMARLGYTIFSVPITYDRREGHSKLSPYLDGIKITWMLIKNLLWKPSTQQSKTFLLRTRRQRYGLEQLKA
jgi:glycosyltransferase involved in cell wall biosynthesis